MTFLFQKEDVQDEEMAEKLCIRKKRFMQFASVHYDGEYYMTPRDFLFSVMFDKPGRKLPVINHTTLLNEWLWNNEITVCPVFSVS